MQQFIRCSKCGSTDLMYSKKRHVYICDNCSYEFTIDNTSIKRHIILCYADDCNDLAFQLKIDLESQGHEVKLSENRKENTRENDPCTSEGLVWTSEVIENGRFIILMTPRSVGRPNGSCLYALSGAIQRKIPIIPLMVSWCEPPLSICRIQWLDMIGCLKLDKSNDQYKAKLLTLLSTLNNNETDYRGAQSKLLRILEPLPFDTDIQRHLIRFTGRKWVFDRIDSWLSDTNTSRIFWIVGAPGSGKTAISSWLSFNRKEIAAFHLCSYGDIQKSDPRRIISSIAYQLSTQLPDYQSRLNSLNLEKILHESNVKMLFESLIIQPLSGNFPPPDRKIVILIDALDEATNEGKNEISNLIANEFEKTPPWLRLIITSRPETEVLHPLQSLMPYILDTSSPENVLDLKEYLSRELKQYSTDDLIIENAIDMIVRMSEGIFLYIEWIRQELSQNRLSLDRLNEFPHGLMGVYSHFFSRRYPDINKYKTGLRPVLEVIISALEPLPIKMVSSIFHWDEYEEADFNQNISSLFPINDGNVKPFHRSIVDWLTDVNKSSEYYVDKYRGNLLLSEYGMQEYSRGINRMSLYSQAHLPAHLIFLEKWGNVKTILTNIKYFNKVWSLNEFDVKAYWTKIEEKSQFKIIDSYKMMLDHPDDYEDDVSGVADLFSDTGHIQEALSLYDDLILHSRNSNNKHQLRKVLDKKGTILFVKGELKEAMQIFKEEESICKELNDVKELQTCLSNQTKILWTLGDIDGMLEKINEIDSISGGQISKDALQKSLHTQALVLYHKGELDNALKLCKEKERICREIKDKNALSSTLLNMGLIYYEKGNLVQAMKLFKELEQISREIGSKYGLAFSLDNQTSVLYDKGLLDEAMKLSEEAIRLRKDLGDKNGVSVCLGDMCLVLYDRCKFDRAIELHKQEEAICKELNDIKSLQTSLGNQALILYAKGNLNGAMDLLKEKEKICQEIQYKNGLQVVYGNQALILYDRGMFKEALYLHKKEQNFCNDMGNKRELNISLCNQANLLSTIGNDDEALRLIDNAELFFRSMENKNCLQVCFNIKSKILIEKNDLKQAWSLLKEAETICRYLQTPISLQICLGNQAIILHLRNDINGAMKLLIEAEVLCREIGHQEGLAISLIDQAIILTFNLDKPQEGLALARESLAIVESCSMKLLESQIKPILDSIEEEASIISI